MLQLCGLDCRLLALLKLSCCSRITQEGRLSVLTILFPTFEARRGRSKTQLPAVFKVLEQKAQLTEFGTPSFSVLFCLFQARYGATHSHAK